MKWGKWFRDEVERRIPDWKGQVMSYKLLKKQLNLINTLSRGRMMQVKRPRVGGFLDANDLRGGSIGFTRLLDSELDKVNEFYFDKEEDNIIRLKELQIRAENLGSDAEKLEVQKDILDFHAEMVLLLHYSVLNFTGLVKIVKKHNKKTGTSFQFSSMPRAMQQPFFSTELLYKLMKECEAMLSRLLLSDEP